MKEAIIALTVIALIQGCTNKTEATRILKENGYRAVIVTGWDPMMGDKGDFYSTGFQAISPSGCLVRGAVTSGLWFKGATIRFK